MPVLIKYAALPLPLITQGKVEDRNLEQIQQTRFWLKNQIQFKGFHDFKEVVLCTIDHKGRIYVDAGN
ncbi:uncharacterized membrane protein YcaP (DUF421 family) [Paenibacillus shirakamiensis]|uniref:Uncharacterized membrane protein YcaP (DUF421 family) n=1 Tax=Paenibacillus shirakamiensis TaxID=1265935 RepID=A0ABS4JBB3_9BACL|nr:uncharacterized membrane protein YcaP (DUF421 family) [Paenibacillus shirakamiensis]